MWALNYASYMYHKKEKKALAFHPCLFFFLYCTLRFVFNFLSMYKFSTFAVVFHTYDATESHIVKLCLKNINTHMYLASDMVIDYRSIAFSKANIVEAIFWRPER